MAKGPACFTNVRSGSMPLKKSAMREVRPSRVAPLTVFYRIAPVLLNRMHGEAAGYGNRRQLYRDNGGCLWFRFFHRLRTLCCGSGSLLRPIRPATRFMRSIRKLAAGDGGTSVLVTIIIAGAESSSFTGIAARTRLANGDSVHCAGAIARRSEWVRQVNNVSAD